MPKRSVSFRDWQLEKLANPERAAKYLETALRDSPEMFYAAVGRVAKARTMAKIAEESGIQRESLYRSLSENGNPTSNTLFSVLKTLGIEMTFRASKKEVGGTEEEGNSRKSSATSNFSSEMEGQFMQAFATQCIAMGTIPGDVSSSIIGGGVLGSRTNTATSQAVQEIH